MQKKEWSVILLVQAMEENANYAKYLFDDILSAGIHDKVNLRICLNSTHEAIMVIDPGLAMDAFAKGVEFCTYFLKNKTGKGKKGKAATLECFAKDATIDFSTKEGMLKSLEIIGEPTDARRTLVMTWDHGSAFGLFKLTKGTGQRFGVDYTMLRGEDLHKVFKTVYKEDKVDILLMMNCFMNFLTFGFAINTSVKYLIACENFIQFTGFNYRDIFQLLNDDPGISARKLSKRIVELQDKALVPPASRGKEHDMMLFQIQKNNEELVLCANSLLPFETIGVYFDNLLNRILLLVDNGIIQREQFIEDCKGSLVIDTKSAVHIVDFYSLLQTMSTSSNNDDEVQKNIQAIYAAFSRSLVAKYIGTNERGKLPAGHEDKISISIYFPNVPFPEQGLYDSAVYQDFLLETSPYASTFSLLHVWDNFLTKLIPVREIE